MVRLPANRTSFFHVPYRGNTIFTARIIKIITKRASKASIAIEFEAFLVHSFVSSLNPPPSLLSTGIEILLAKGDEVGGTLGTNEGRQEGIGVGISAGDWVGDVHGGWMGRRCPRKSH